MFLYLPTDVNVVLSLWSDNLPHHTVFLRAERTDFCSELLSVFQSLMSFCFSDVTGGQMKKDETRHRIKSLSESLFPRLHVKNIKQHSFCHFDGFT